MTPPPRHRERHRGRRAELRPTVVSAEPAGRHRADHDSRWWTSPRRAVGALSLAAVVTGAAAGSVTLHRHDAGTEFGSRLARTALATETAWPPLRRTTLSARPADDAATGTADTGDDTGDGTGDGTPAGLLTPVTAAVDPAAPITAPPAGAAAPSEQPADPQPELQPGAGEGPAAVRDAQDTTARDMVAAAVTIDPALLEAQPGDSEDTLAARAELALLADRLAAVSDRYDEVARVAHRRQQRSEATHAALLQAREQAQAAEEEYRKDHEDLVALVNGAYVSGSLGTVGMVLRSDDGTDLLAGMTIAAQVNLDKSNVVRRAEESADRLAAAHAEATARDDAARMAAAAAGKALGRAHAARREVEDEVLAARQVLVGSVLADEAEESVAAAALAGLQLAAGSVVFPLAPGASFVNQDNFGHASARWASYHTGADFSTACGTPVLAATAGTVAVRTDQPWSGRWLVVVRSDSSTVATWYAHMQALAVADGEQVAAGQVIGAVGTEGNSTGCHLHFEYHPAGGSIYEDATDPVPWLQSLGAYPWS